jgi:hypothetical protein
MTDLWMCVKVAAVDTTNRTESSAEVNGQNFALVLIATVRTESAPALT